MSKIGVLLTNTGTPDAPTSSAIRHYLKEFLSDSRVVQIPRFIWWPILYGFILRFRPKRSLKLYQEIWTDQGSPLLIYSTYSAFPISGATVRENPQKGHGFRLNNPTFD